MMPLDRAMFADKLNRYMSQFNVPVEDLSRQTGIDLERAKALLDLSAEPTGDEVLILADYFKCDFKFFISNEKLAPFEQTEALFRMHGSDLAPEDRWAIQEFLFLCECQEYLLSMQQDARRQSFLFKKTGKFYKQHGTDAAAALRRHLGYAPHEIPGNVFDAFRRIRVHVFRRKLGRSAISGLFVRHPSAGACVLVNYSEDVFRQRFTAAHETGHAILDDGKDFVVSFGAVGTKDLSEVRANTFASRFLLPPEFLMSIPAASAWTDAEFLDHAARLLVNAETLAYALSDARLVSGSRAKALAGLKVPQSRKADPELPASLSPRSLLRKQELLQRGLSDSYVSLCFDAYERDSISAGRLAEILLVSEAELAEIAGLYGRALSHGD